jgi:multidrug resistance efflux pump
MPLQAAINQQQGAESNAEAKVAQAQLDLDWTVVRAGQDGWITA